MDDEQENEQMETPEWKIKWNKLPSIKNIIYDVDSFEAECKNLLLKYKIEAEHIEFTINGKTYQWNF